MGTTTRDSTPRDRTNLALNGVEKKEVSACWFLDFPLLVLNEYTKDDIIHGHWWW